MYDHFVVTRPCRVKKGVIHYARTQSGGQKFAYQGVRNVSFSDNFAYVLNGQSQAKDKLIKLGLSSFQDTVPEFNLDKISDG